MYHQPELNFTADEVIFYSRKSQSDDPRMSVEEVLAKHEAILDEMAERHFGCKIPEKNKYREVVSGETIKGRPEIQKVLSLLEGPRYRAIMVVEEQRISRGDLEDIGYITKFLRHTNTLVITQYRIYDLSDDHDRDAFERELKRGNEYLEYYKKIQRRGREASNARGNYLGSIPPYGFDRITVMDGKEKCPTLKENPERADVVRLIFDLFVNKDMGRCSIANYLDNLGIKPLNAKHWAPPTIREILTNVHYIGKVRWNRRKSEIIVSEGEFINKRPRAKDGDYMIHEGRHDGIVSEELFYAAQEKLGRLHRAKKGVKVRNLFSSIMFCKKCGRAVIYKHDKRPDGTEKSGPRLMCSDQGHCDSGSCLYTDVLDRVCVILRECIENFEIQMERETDDSAKLHAKLIANLEKKLKELNAREVSQWEAQTDPDPAKRMPQTIFQQLNAKLQKEKEETQRALANAYESVPEPVDYEAKIMMFQDALDALKDPDCDPETANQLLKLCIDRIEYYRPRPQRINGKWNDPPVELDVSLLV